MRALLQATAPVLALGLLSPLAAAQGVAVNDTFDRPGPNLGPDWTRRELGAPPATIQNNRFTANTSLFSYYSHNVYDAPYDSSVARIDWTFSSGFLREDVAA